MSKPKQHRRFPKVVPATLVLLVLALNPPEEGSTSIDPERPAPPSPEQVQVLEELMEWVKGEYSDHFRGMGHTDLTAAVRARSRSFQIFRSYNEAADTNARLSLLPYGSMIRRISRHNKVDGLLVAAVMEAESGFNPNAESPRGAQGLMQVMPSTPGFPEEAGAFDPALNIEIGTRYLRHLLRRFDGDLVLTLAAYNAGPGTVERVGGVPPYRETRRYVAKVLSLYVRHHQKLWESSGAGEFVFDVELPENDILAEWDLGGPLLAPVAP